MKAVQHESTNNQVAKAAFFIAGVHLQPSKPTVHGALIMIKVTIDLLVMDDACEPYICGVRGACTISDLQAIEKEIIENRDDHLPTDGTYAIECSWFKGQYDEYGRCEIAPGWEWEIVEFSPFDIPEESI